MSLTLDHYRLKSRYCAFTFQRDLLVKIQGILISIRGHGFSWIHGPHKETISALVCLLGSLPLFQGGLHLGFLQCPDYPVYYRGPYNHQYPPAELTPILNHQGHLLLIIWGDSRELNLDKDISNGLHIVTPLQLTGILLQCRLRSSMESTLRPRHLTNDGVTVFIWVPLLIRAVTSSPLIIAWPIFSGPSHLSQVSSFQ